MYKANNISIDIEYSTISCFRNNKLGRSVRGIMRKNITRIGVINMKIERIPELTLMMGLVLVATAYLLPYNSFAYSRVNGMLGSGLKPLSFICLYVTPILGITGSAFSIYTKEWLSLILNIILIFTFFLIIATGYAM